jgi:hypothetical protein
MNIKKFFETLVTFVFERLLVAVIFGLGFGLVFWLLARCAGS